MASTSQDDPFLEAQAFGSPAVVVLWTLANTLLETYFRP